MKTSKIDEKAIGMFEKDLFTLQMIGDTYGVSRTSVLKYLRKQGVDTSKRQREVICSNLECSKMILRTKKRAREIRTPCCSPECYFKVIDSPEYQSHRQNQRIAREVITANATIEDFVPHHVDGDSTNNEVKNLWAFKTQGDHMKFHRGGKAKAFILSKMVWVEVSST